MHTTKSAEKITPFGGLNFCLNSYHHSGLASLIDRHLGPRVKTSGFSYSEIIANQLAVFFAGGECAEDLSEHLRGPLSGVKGLRLCSPDTLLRGIKELSCASTERVHPTSGVRHTFNINELLNDMMVKALRLTGQLSEQEYYDLDYDNQVLPAQKWDAGRTYKNTYGYQPGIASIDNMPVYIEGRGGNSPATFAQAQTLQRLFGRLEAHTVRIDWFRADSVSYQKEVVEVVEAHTKRFCIRAKRSAEMARQLAQIPDAEWTPITLNWKKMEVAELSWTPFGGEAAYRLVVTRIKRADRQGDLFSGDAYTWRAIITNDHTTSAEQIVAFYNKRGNSERLFDVMNNDFGWSRLPCSFLSENTAFMIIMAIVANFYRYILGLYAEKLPWLQPTYRLKKFIFRFISVPAKWIRSGRRNILKLYTDKDYAALE